MAGKKTLDRFGMVLTSSLIIICGRLCLRIKVTETILTPNQSCCQSSWPYTTDPGGNVTHPDSYPSIIASVGL